MDEEPKVRKGLNLSLEKQPQKKPSQQNFEQIVNEMEKRKLSFQEKTRNVAVSFLSLMKDKTLSENKTVFQKDKEKEVLSNIVSLTKEIDDDPNEEKESPLLSWIILLFKISLAQKDKYNLFEYKSEKSFSLLNEEISFLKKEIENLKNGKV